MAVTNNDVMERLNGLEEKLNSVAEMANQLFQAKASVKDVENYFDKLNQTNVNDHTEQKNGLTYLSWAWAWAELKKACPDVTYTVYERQTEYGPCNYFTDGRTCWVKTGVTMGDLEYIEMLPVMDFKNRSIPYENVTSMDVNKAIQRSLTKAAARHGLGLYIYAGEDLPEESEEDRAARMEKEREAVRAAQELAALQRNVDVQVRRLIASATPEQKKSFGDQHIKSVLGDYNYKTCADREKLTALYNSLKAMETLA